MIELHGTVRDLFVQVLKLQWNTFGLNISPDFKGDPQLYVCSGVRVCVRALIL